MCLRIVSHVRFNIADVILPECWHIGRRAQRDPCGTQPWSRRATERIFHSTQLIQRTDRAQYLQHIAMVGLLQCDQVLNSRRATAYHFAATKEQPRPQPTRALKIDRGSTTGDI